MGTIKKGLSVASESLLKATNVVEDLVSSKRQFIVKQLTNALLLLVILLVFGCFDFLHLKFHYEYLIDYNYWVNIVIKAVADICSYNIGVNFIIDDIINRNMTLARLKIAYEKLNSVKQEDFPVFIHEYNLKQKIIAWKNYINHKIYILNKFARKSDRLRYANWSKATVQEKNRYCLKRYRLETMKTDAFIQENIDNLEAPYKDIDVAVFELEINGAEKIVQNKVTGSVTKGRAIASVSTLLGVVLFSAVFQPIGLQPNKNEFESQMVAAVNTAIKISTDIGIIIWQFTRGIFGTPKIVSNQMTIPLSERVKILKEYYSWRKSKGEEVPQCYLDLLKEKREEDAIEVELTQEQIEKVLKKED